jgi:hypothetical protein
MQYFNLGIKKYLIVASHNTKINKISSIVIPLFGLLEFLLGLRSIVMNVLRLTLRVKVFHGPKKNQSLCNTVMGVLSLRIGLMEYVLFCLEGIA